MLHYVRCLTAVTALLGLVPVAAAQELGVGLTAAGVQFNSRQWAFEFAANRPYVRATFSVSPVVAIEPVAGIAIVSGKDVNLTTVVLGLGTAIYPQRTSGRNSLFVSLAASVILLSSDASGTGSAESQPYIQVGAGTKVPIGPQVSLRVEGQLGDAFATRAFDASNIVRAEVGLCVRVRNRTHSETTS